MEDLDGLTQEAMQPWLQGKLFLTDRYHFHSLLDSTNRKAMDMAHQDAPEGTVVVAEEQTHGRGRYGRKWASPGGLNLYFSMVLRPEIGVSEAPRLTLVTGLALAETLVAMGVTEAIVKWPNDILVNGRKLAGILAEMSSSGERVRFVIIGVGVNVNGSAASYPPEVAKRAVTMAEILHMPLMRRAILGRFFEIFEFWYHRFLTGDFTSVRQGWRSYARLKGCQVGLNVPSGPIVGEALDINEEGYLQVKQENGVIYCVKAGEVMLVQE